MKTETPLVDAQARSGSKHAGGMSPFVTAEFARKLEVVMRAMADALKAIHDHNSESCNVFFEQDGNPIGVSCDLGEAYQESDICDNICKALEQFNSLKS